MVLFFRFWWLFLRLNKVLFCRFWSPLKGYVLGVPPLPLLYFSAPVNPFGAVAPSGSPRKPQDNISKQFFKFTWEPPSAMRSGPLPGRTSQGRQRVLKGPSQELLLKEPSKELLVKDPSKELLLKDPFKELL